MTAAVVRGDAQRLPLPDASVDLIMTSPPYFGLRSYTDGGVHYDGQIGSERTPAEWLAALLDCTAEWARVLKSEGSIFVNLGDKYGGPQGGGGFSERSTLAGFTSAGVKGRQLDQARPRLSAGFPRKSLLGLPWRYAIGCMDQLGLILRRDIIWSKLSALPESADDRCTTRHEYLFHLVKQPRYYAATDEIREPHSMDAHGLSRRSRTDKRLAAVNGGQTTAGNALGKLPGSVWEITATPLVVPDRIAHARCCGGRKRPGCEDGLDHHAAFPLELPRRCILGWSPPGVCVQCGQGRRPVSTSQALSVRPNFDGKRGLLPKANIPGQSPQHDRMGDRIVTITGYACACPTPDAPTRPAVILDPFGGTGSTALVASVLGRDAITFDLSADYCRLARWRTSDPGERARAMQVPKPPPVPDGQDALFALESP